MHYIGVLEKICCFFRIAIDVGRGSLGNTEEMSITYVTECSCLTVSLLGEQSQTRGRIISRVPRLRVGLLPFTLAQDNLSITLLMSQYPTDYDHLSGNKSLRWLMWHRAASFSCISMWWKLFLCKMCALVCSKTCLSSQLLIFDTITYGFSCTKTCVYFDNLTSDLRAIWLLQVEDERLMKMSFCTKVSF